MKTILLVIVCLLVIGCSDPFDCYDGEAKYYLTQQVGKLVWEETTTYTRDCYSLNGYDYISYVYIDINDNVVGEIVLYGDPDNDYDWYVETWVIY